MAIVRRNRRDMTKVIGMTQTRKPWVSKLRPEMAPKIVEDPRGRGKMLVPTPLLVAEEIRKTKKGELVTPGEIRSRLAERFKANLTCPLTTGIFINILAGAAEEELKEGKSVTAPYWRVVSEEGYLSEKTPPGPELQAQHLKKEGRNVERVKNKWRVV